ncbi:MAG TPA: Mur ligase family protein [Gaiellaceae bacterium]|nr:Mur ligase family protein [Gaiellaceae bacterium]
MGSHAEWIESLSLWPEEFGLERMHALLEDLGHPERKFPSVHVVGTNGKSTATRTIAELLRAEGLRAGAYTSPHVSGWEERLDTDAEGFERAVGGIRSAAVRAGATQFEALTAAALSEFASRRVDVAVIEAGLGGRLDATNVVEAPVVYLTNVSLEHTDVLGETREEIAREKLAVARATAIVVLGEPEWAHLLPESDVRLGGAREAAEAFLGRPVQHEVEVRLPGRLEWRAADELWDGAHTPEAVDWLLERLPPGDWVVVASVLRDKDVDAMLERLARVTRLFVATQSSNARAMPADELAGRARRYVSDVVTVEDPVAAVRRAHELGPRVLVTGSLYLLADLHAAAR